MNSDRRPDLIRIFRDEANERLDRIVELLLAAERDSPSEETIRSLFREVHSLKGGAGMFGADEAYTVADAVEDVLGEAREQGWLDASLIGPLLRTADALRSVVEGHPVDTDALADLSRARQRDGHPAPAEQPPSAEEHAEAAQPRPEARDTTAPAPPPEPASAGGEPPPAAAPAPSPAGNRRSVRVDVEKVDRLLDAVGENALHQRRLEEALRRHGAERPSITGPDAASGGETLDELQEAVIALRILPVASITGPFPRLVRDVAAQQGKAAELIITGADTQIDRVVLDGAREAIGHLLRNAVAHGIEPPDERAAAGKARHGRIELRAVQRGHRVVVSVEDDGRGVAPELIRQASRGGSLADVLSRAGLSTASTITAAAGRGVGLDAVRDHVEALGGDLEVRSEVARGTIVSLTLPVSLALPHVLLVRRADNTFGIPLASVSEVLVVEERLQLGDRVGVDVRGIQLPLVDLMSILGGEGPSLQARPPAVVVSSSGGRVALLCDEVLCEEQTLVKPLGPLLEPVVTGYVGGAVMLDGDIALILDVPRLIAAADEHHGDRAALPAAPAAAASTVPSILVVDDQFTVRELQRSILEAAGYRVETAHDGRQAWQMISQGTEVDLVLTDIEMPHMDGLALAAAIRRRPETERLPIVMVTSRGSEEHRRRGMDAGADAYIVKERFDQRRLLDTVKRLVQR